MVNNSIETGKFVINFSAPLIMMASGINNLETITHRQVEWPWQSLCHISQQHCIYHTAALIFFFFILSEQFFTLCQDNLETPLSLSCHQHLTTL